MCLVVIGTWVAGEEGQLPFSLRGPRMLSAG